MLYVFKGICVVVDLYDVVFVDSVFTKLHEEVLRGTAAELAEQVGDLKGECVLVIAPPSKEELAPQVTAADLDDEIRAGLAAGESKSSLAKRLAKELSRPKSEIYDRILELS